MVFGLIILFGNNTVMKRLFPWIFLAPVLFLLAMLPWQLRGELPYRVTTFRYVESLFMWMLFFVAFVGMSRRARWTRPILALVGVEMLVSSAISVWTGGMGVATFLIVLAVVCFGIACAWTMSPPIRRSIEAESE